MSQKKIIRSNKLENRMEKNQNFTNKYDGLNIISSQQHVFTSNIFAIPQNCDDLITNIRSCLIAFDDSSPNFLNENPIDGLNNQIRRLLQDIEIFKTNSPLIEYIYLVERLSVRIHSCVDVRMPNANVNALINMITHLKYALTCLLMYSERQEPLASYEQSRKILIDFIIDHNNGDYKVITIIESLEQIRHAIFNLSPSDDLLRRLNMIIRNLSSGVLSLCHGNILHETSHLSELEYISASICTLVDNEINKFFALNRHKQIIDFISHHAVPENSSNSASDLSNLLNNLGERISRSLIGNQNSAYFSAPSRMNFENQKDSIISDEHLKIGELLDRKSYNNASAKIHNLNRALDHDASKKKRFSVSIIEESSCFLLKDLNGENLKYSGVSEKDICLSQDFLANRPLELITQGGNSRNIIPILEPRLALFYQFNTLESVIKSIKNIFNSGYFSGFLLLRASNILVSVKIKNLMSCFCAMFSNVNLMHIIFNKRMWGPIKIFSLSAAAITALWTSSLYYRMSNDAYLNTSSLSRHTKVNPDKYSNVIFNPNYTSISQIAYEGIDSNKDFNINTNIATPKNQLFFDSDTIQINDKRIELQELIRRATNGVSSAQFQLSFAYLNGQGLRKDISKYLFWLHRAAENKLPLAQYYLGHTYDIGDYVNKDNKIARYWYLRAAEAGNIDAMYNLAVSYADNSNLDMNFVEAFRWFKQAAQLGMRDSQYNLGMMYLQGVGVERDYLLSYKWFSAAYFQGDLEAMKKRDEVFDLIRKKRDSSMWNLLSN